MMEVIGLSKYFGGLAAVMELDLEVSEGAIIGLIGPNGAGKSTALNIIGGMDAPTKGKVVFQGEEVTGLSPHRMAAKGVARVFQDNLLFASFSVLENVLAGLHLQTRMHLADIFFGGRRSRRHDRELADRSLALLESLGLAGQKDELAVSLPAGKQRVLSLAVAMATEPKLLLLDEPLAGMNAEEVDHMMEIVRSLRTDQGVTCLVVEHNLRAVMGLCDRITVLNFGQKIAEGRPAEIAEDPEVIEAYIGSDEDAAWAGQTGS